VQSRIYKASEPKKGYTPIVSPKNSELKYVEFGRLCLPQRGDEYRGTTADREAVLAIFGGKCSAEIECPSQTISYAKIGNRTDVFSGKPTMIYLPPKAEFKLTAETEMLEVGVCLAPSEADCPPVLVRPEDVVEKSAGTSNWSRKVYTCVGDNVKAKRLLVGETVNPPGNWSSAPPHKHDVKSAFETPLEEVYFFKIMPTQGFGLQRIYSGPEDREPFDEVYVVENNDAVVIPRGYHPVVAGPGYQLYYLWMLAGEERRYGAWTDDPRHSWLRDRESQISEVSHHL